MSEPTLTLCEVAPDPEPGLFSHSPFSDKANRALTVAGLPYERRAGAHPGVFRDLNPAGQVPVLLVDGEPVYDSTRILDWIESHRPGSLDPSDSDEAAAARLWEELADTSLNGFVVAARWADDDNWPTVKEAFFGRAPGVVRALVTPRIRKKVVAALIARDVWRRGPHACWRDMESLLDALDRRAPAKGPWLGDGRVTRADVALYAQLRSLASELTPRQAEAVRSRRRLSDWMERAAEAMQRQAAAEVSSSFRRSA